MTGGAGGDGDTMSTYVNNVRGTASRYCIIICGRNKRVIVPCLGRVASKVEVNTTKWIGRFTRHRFLPSLPWISTDLILSFASASTRYATNTLKTYFTITVDGTEANGIRAYYYSKGWSSIDNVMAIPRHQ